MSPILSDILARLIDNPKSGAVASGVTSFGGYGLAKFGTTLSVINIDVDFIQSLGIISMTVGIIVGLVTLVAAVIRMRADKMKRDYYKKKCQEENT